MVSGISNTHALNNVKTSLPVMKTQTNPVLERTPQTDTLEKKEKKKLSTAKKIGIGVVGTFVALVGTGLAIAAHQRNKIAKLYKEKLILSNLGENLQFKEAASVEEGIKFAKEVLKIPEVDSNFTLEAINTTNKGLVDVSNANKGKLFMPRALRFAEDKNHTWIAAVNHDIKSEAFGELSINKIYYDHNHLDKEITELLYRDGSKKFIYENGKLTSCFMPNYIAPVPDSDVANLIMKFYDNSGSLTLKEKQTLFATTCYINSRVGMCNRAPISFLEKLQNAQSYRNYINNGGEKIDFEKIKNLTTEEQGEYAMKILKQMQESKNSLNLTFKPQNPETDIYHEMGHLQDFAKNLKELDMAKWQLPNFKQAWEDAKQNKNPRSKEAKNHEIDNRWGSIQSHEGFGNFFKEHPEEFKKNCPELYEFLTDKEIQQTAGEISLYAQSGIGEFIAETYAKMIDGKPVSEKVKALYKKYKGPELA